MITKAKTKSKVDPSKVVDEAKKLAKAKTGKSEAYETLRRRFRVARITPYFKKVDYHYPDIRG